jgi:hypothetical protein
MFHLRVPAATATTLLTSIEPQIFPDLLDIAYCDTPCIGNRRQPIAATRMRSSNALR